MPHSSSRQDQKEGINSFVEAGIGITQQSCTVQAPKVLQTGPF
ncbi:hypothetical protein TH47_12430 [Thalassospira sp. MCCC 1A02803]|nr:hypothetical protein TH47_12430 [Thalassospira sp. MCCC 1A02803]